MNEISKTLSDLVFVSILVGIAMAPHILHTYLRLRQVDNNSPGLNREKLDNAKGLSPRMKTRTKT
jgi:hypothetical protein